MTNISRISTLETSNTMLDYIMDSETKYNELTKKAASGLEVSNPSDDPIAAKKILNLTSQIDELSGYAKNISNAENEVNITTSALDSLTNLVQKASDYATQAANGTYNQDDLDVIKSEIDQIIEAVVDLANTSYDGKYVFSGTATATETYTITKDVDGNITDITYNGTDTDDYERYVTISNGVSVAINLDGEDIFGSYEDGTPPTATGLLGDLMTLSSSLEDGDTDTVSSCIDSLSTDLITITTSNTRLSAIANRMEMTNDSLEETITNLTSYKSSLQDADLTEVLSDLTLTESALEATYTVTSALLSQTSLLDYI